MCPISHTSGNSKLKGLLAESLRISDWAQNTWAWAGWKGRVENCHCRRTLLLSKDHHFSQLSHTLITGSAIQTLAAVRRNVKGEGTGRKKKRKHISDNWNGICLVFCYSCILWIEKLISKYYGYKNIILYDLDSCLSSFHAFAFVFLLISLMYHNYVFTVGQLCLN